MRNFNAISTFAIRRFSFFVDYFHTKQSINSVNVRRLQMYNSKTSGRYCGSINYQSEYYYWLRVDIASHLSSFSCNELKTNTKLDEKCFISFEHWIDKSIRVLLSIIWWQQLLQQSKWSWKREDDFKLFFFLLYFGSETDFQVESSAIEPIDGCLPLGNDLQFSLANRQCSGLWELVWRSFHLMLPNIAHISNSKCSATNLLFKHISELPYLLKSFEISRGMSQAMVEMARAHCSFILITILGFVGRRFLLGTGRNPQCSNMES